MKLIISPAKKMNEELDFLPPEGEPQFIERSQILLDYLKGLDYPALKALLRCNDQLTALNFQRYAVMDLHSRLTPAVLAYEGIQYRYMAPRFFSWEQYGYLKERLRILSGFYGLLRPFDGVTPYRLEMQARLRTSFCTDLYGFWGTSLALALAQETDTVVDLASKEYSRAVLPHLPRSVRVVSCTFAQRKGDKLLESGTQCKMARGEMVRFLTESGETDPEAMKGFDRLGYRFHPELSGTERLVFVQEPG